MGKTIKKYGIKAIYTNHTDRKLLEQVSRFLCSFEGVFDHDWDYTKSAMENAIDHDLIKENGTFIKPLVEDESNNWGNRGSLLDEYRTLRKVLEKYDLYSEERFFELRDNDLELIK